MDGFDKAIYDGFKKVMQDGKRYDVRIDNKFYYSCIFTAAKFNDEDSELYFKVFFKDEKEKIYAISSETVDWSIYELDKQLPFLSSHAKAQRLAFENTLKDDKVNSPKHYNFGNIEVIDFIHQVVKNYPGHLAYSIGNVIKYVARAPFKNGLEDLKKAEWYLKDVINHWEDKDNG